PNISLVGQWLRWLCFGCRGSRFNPWLGNEEPTFAWHGKKKKDERKKEYTLLGEGIVKEFGIDMVLSICMLFLKWMTNKDLLYSMGNYTQYFV
ncbi:hypothetical protein LZB42_09115, partial [Campylobacter jejuni]